MTTAPHLAHGGSPDHPAPPVGIANLFNRVTDQDASIASTDAKINPPDVHTTCNIRPQLVDAHQFAETSTTTGAQRREQSSKKLALLTVPCVSTCARGAGIHGYDLNVHTEAFSNPQTDVVAFSAYQEKLTWSSHLSLRRFTKFAPEENRDIALFSTDNEFHRAINEEDIDFNIPGLPHSAVKQSHGTNVQGLIQKIENHPHRQALQSDLQQRQQFNLFSKESKDMIRAAGNIELCELLDVQPKAQCNICLSY